MPAAARRAVAAGCWYGWPVGLLGAGCWPYGGCGCCPGGCCGGTWAAAGRAGCCWYAAGPASAGPAAAAGCRPRPQALLLLGACEVLGDQRGEVEVRLAGLGPHHVEVELGAGGQVLVERHDDDAAAAGLEVRHDVLDLDHLAGLADPGDDRDAALRRARRSRARRASRAWCWRCSHRPRTGVEMMISWSARSSTPRIAL